MLNIELAAGQVIAADTQASVAAIDQAVLACARLCGSIVEVSSSSQLPLSAAQQALISAAGAISAAVQGREELTRTTRELLRIQGASSLEAVGFGCPNGLPPKTAQHDVEITGAAT